MRKKVFAKDGSIFRCEGYYSPVRGLLSFDAKTDVF